MKRILIIFALTILSIALTSCSGLPQGALKPAPKAPLQCLTIMRDHKISGECRTPEEGITISEAEQIINDIYHPGTIKTDKDVRTEDAFFNTGIQEITTKEAWENTHAQIYIDHTKFLENIVVIKNHKAFGNTNGWYPVSIYLADLNTDGFYEICSNVEYGSGYINSFIEVYDTESSKTFRLNKRNEMYDLILRPEGDKLMVDMPTYNNEHPAKDPGELLLNDGKLYIIQKNGGIITE